MGWAVGYDHNWRRDIGYGVPAVCDHPDCNDAIHRGLAYVCADQEPYGGCGCGLFFCDKHRGFAMFDDVGDCLLSNCCERCANHKEPFDAKPDVSEWINWKLTDESWQRWRDENPAQVAELK